MSATTLDSVLSGLCTENSITASPEAECALGRIVFLSNLQWKLTMIFNISVDLISW